MSCSKHVCSNGLYAKSDLTWSSRGWGFADPDSPLAPRRLKARWRLHLYQLVGESGVNDIADRCADVAGANIARTAANLQRHFHPTGIKVTGAVHGGQFISTWHVAARCVVADKAGQPEIRTRKEPIIHVFTNWSRIEALIGFMEGKQPLPQVAHMPDVFVQIMPVAAPIFFLVHNDSLSYKGRDSVVVWIGGFDVLHHFTG